MARKHAGLLAQSMQAYDRCQIMIDDNQSRYLDSWLYDRCLKPYNITVDIIDGKEVDCWGNHEATTEYVSPVLRTAKAQISAPMVSTFTGDTNSAVYLRDYSFQTDPELEKVINEQLNQIILQKNDGKSLLRAAADDTLVTGDSFGKVYIQPNISRDKLELGENWMPYMQIKQMAGMANWLVEIDEEDIDAEPKGDTGRYQWKTEVQEVQDPDTGITTGEQNVVMVRGTIPLIRDDKEVIIEVVGLKDLVIDTTCGSDWSKLRFISHKRTTTVGDAIKMGFKKKDLEDASTLSEISETPYNKRQLVSGDQVSTNEDWHGTEGADPMERPIRLYESYFYSSLPSGRTKLYQEFRTDTTQLSYQEVAFIPFVHGQMKPISDSFWGESLYDYCKGFQDIESDNIRIAKKNLIDSTFKKTIAVKGKYDRSSLVNSHRPGAIIEVNENPAYVTPMGYEQLPQSYGLLTEQINSQKQELVGNLVGSINAEDAASGQLAASTVAQLLSQEGLKTKQIAGVFAETFVSPLYRLVYRTLVEEGINIQLESGKTVNSKDFPSVYEFVIDINTQNDTTAKNAQLAAVLNMMSAAQPTKLAPYSSWYKVADEMLQQVGLKAKDYFPDPAQMQVDQDEQLQKLAQQELVKTQIEFVNSQVALNVAKTASEKVKMEETIKTEEVERQIKMVESTVKNNMAQNKHAVEVANLLHKTEKDKADTTIDVGKLNLDKIAVGAEIAQGAHDIAIKRVNTIQKKFNGIRE